MTAKKWANSINRFKDLKEKLGQAITQREQAEFKLTKMLLKCTIRIIKE
jgi:hypothetical protein